MESSAAIPETVKDTIAGTIAGITGRVVEHPLDTVKVRLQVQDTARSKIPLYKNSLDCCFQMIRSEGIAGFFRGVSAPIGFSAAETATLFASYNRGLTLLHSTVFSAAAGGASVDPKERGKEGGSEEIVPSGGAVLAMEEHMKIPLYGHALAGAFAGFIAAHVLTPMEAIKCKMQAGPKRPGQNPEPTRRILSRLFRTTMKYGWWKILYRGHTATLAREVPGTASWFGFYELVISLILSSKQAKITDRTLTKDDLSNVSLACAGGCAGVMYWSTFFPADVVKTRMQLDSKFAKKGIMGGLKTIYRTKGIAGLYAGYLPTIFRAFPSHATVFLTYEKMMDLLRNGFSKSLRVPSVSSSVSQGEMKALEFTK